MISRQNQEEFKSLGIDRVKAYIAHAVYDPAKDLEAREWVGKQENRIPRSTIAAWVSAGAAVVVAIVGIATFMLSHR
jgi:hypothetical protein